MIRCKYRLVAWNWWVVSVAVLGLFQHRTLLCAAEDGIIMRPLPSGEVITGPGDVTAEPGEVTTEQGQATQDAPVRDIIDRLDITSLANFPGTEDEIQQTDLREPQRPQNGSGHQDVAERPGRDQVVLSTKLSVRTLKKSDLQSASSTLDPNPEEEEGDKEKNSKVVTTEHPKEDLHTNNQVSTSDESNQSENKQAVVVGGIQVTEVHNGNGQLQTIDDGIVDRENNQNMQRDKIAEGVQDTSVDSANGQRDQLYDNTTPPVTSTDKEMDTEQNAEKLAANPGMANLEAVLDNILSPKSTLPQVHREEESKETEQIANQPGDPEKDLGDFDTNHKGVTSDVVQQNGNPAGMSVIVKEIGHGMKHPLESAGYPKKTAHSVHHETKGDIAVGTDEDSSKNEHILRVINDRKFIRFPAIRKHKYKIRGYLSALLGNGHTRHLVEMPFKFSNVAGGLMVLGNREMERFIRLPSKASRRRGPLKKISDKLDAETKHLKEVQNVIDREIGLLLKRDFGFKGRKRNVETRRVRAAPTDPRERMDEPEEPEPATRETMDGWPRLEGYRDYDEAGDDAGLPESRRFAPDDFPKPPPQMFKRSQDLDRSLGLKRELGNMLTAIESSPTDNQLKDQDEIERSGSQKLNRRDDTQRDGDGLSMDSDDSSEVGIGDDEFPNVPKTDDLPMDTNRPDDDLDYDKSEDEKVENLINSAENDSPPDNKGNEIYKRDVRGIGDTDMMVDSEAASNRNENVVSGDLKEPKLLRVRRKSHHATHPDEEHGSKHKKHYHEDFEEINPGKNKKASGRKRHHKTHTTDNDSNDDEGEKGDHRKHQSDSEEGRSRNKLKIAGVGYILFNEDGSVREQIHENGGEHDLSKGRDHHESEGSHGQHYRNRQHHGKRCNATDRAHGRKDCSGHHKGHGHEKLGQEGRHGRRKDHEIHFGNHGEGHQSHGEETAMQMILSDKRVHGQNAGLVAKRRKAASKMATHILVILSICLFGFMVVLVVVARTRSDHDRIKTVNSHTHLFEKPPRF